MLDETNVPHLASSAFAVEIVEAGQIRRIVLPSLLFGSDTSDAVRAGFLQAFSGIPLGLDPYLPKIPAGFALFRWSSHRLFGPWHPVDQGLLARCNHSLPCLL